MPLIHPNDLGKFDEATIRMEILFHEFDKKGEPLHALAAIKLALTKLAAADASDKDTQQDLAIAESQLWGYQTKFGWPFLTMPISLN